MLGFSSGPSFPLASGVQNAMQQVGGALGLSCLVTLALLVIGGVLVTQPVTPVPAAG